MANTVDLSVILKLVDNASAGFKEFNKEAIAQLNGLKGAEKAVADTTKEVEKSFVELNKKTETIKQSMVSFSDKLKESSTNLKHLGRDISQLGSSLALVGGSITAIFIKALVDSSKYSTETQKALRDLSLTSTQFSNILASSVVPIINKLTNLLQVLLNAFNSISPQLRESILQFIFWGGIILTITGSLTFLIGKIVIFTSNIYAVVSATVAWTAANFAAIAPILAISAALIAIIALMIKFKPISDFVSNSFEVLWRNIEGQLNLWMAGLYKLKATALEVYSAMLNALSKFPSANQEAIKGNAQLLESQAQLAKRQSFNALEDAKKNFSQIKNIFQGQTGSFAVNFDSAKKSINDFISSLTNVKTVGIDPLKVAHLELTQDIVKQENDLRLLKQQIADEDYLREFTLNQNKIQLLTQWKEFAMSAQVSVSKVQSSALSAVNTLTDGFGQAFAGLLVEGKSFGEQMKQVFKSMASLFISEVSKMIAKWLAFTALKAVGKFFGLSGGGFIPGFAEGSGSVMKLASGTDTVPALLTPGEIVVPKSMSDSIRQGELTLGGAKGNVDNSSGDIYININYPQMSKEDEVKKLADMLGFEIQKQLRYARG